MNHDFKKFDNESQDARRHDETHTVHPNDKTRGQDKKIKKETIKPEQHNKNR